MKSYENIINRLKSANSDRLSKYNRNFKAYYNSPNADINNLKSHQVLGYYNYNFGEEDCNTPGINVIKSCIDTLASKIAQSKVRPFFNTINGDYKDIQITKQCQQFFDNLFDKENVNKIISDTFRDACIFDTGVIFVDEDRISIERVLPYQVFINPAEKMYGEITKVYLERKDYPYDILPDKIRDLIKLDNVIDVDYGILWDKTTSKKVYTLNNKIVLEEDYSNKKLPFVWLYYDNPTIGNSSTSVVDTLYSIQLEIDQLMGRISSAMELTPANTIFVPEGSGLKANQINNTIGQIYTYKVSPNITSNPIGVSTPNFIDPQYISLLNELIERAYQLIGISQLSAQSKKPTGLNSGVALATMEDVESERFETQLNQVIHAYVNLAKICISVFNDKDDILPEDNNRPNIKWKDVVKASERMTIQFSAADSLSKDPSTKLQQLQQLVQAGVIPATRMAQFMEIPDIETGYNLATNAINSCSVVISNCIENDNYSIPDYIPFDLLREEIINTQLSLTASNKDSNKEAISKLDKLYKKLEDKTVELEAENTQMNEELNTVSNNERLKSPDYTQQSAESKLNNNENINMTTDTKQSVWSADTNRV